MRVALVADAHLGGTDARPEELAEQLLALRAEDCERLVLLGDIFHVWVGDRRFESAAIRTVFPVLESLRAAGLRIDYIEGNRDFFLAGSVYSPAFSSIGGETTVERDGARRLLVHGDGLDPSDRQYRFWRWLSKSPLSRALILNLPRSVAERALYGAEARIARTNFRHRRSLPRQAITRYAERRLAEGFDELLLGHFHESAEWEVRGGRVSIVDTWFRSRRVEWI
jgi:UDP-2,3-diacylglucosamine hydrolase